MAKNILDIMIKNKLQIIIITLITILIIIFYIYVNNKKNKENEQKNKNNEQKNKIEKIYKDFKNKMSELQKSINSKKNNNNRKKKIQDKQNNYINRFYMQQELARARQLESNRAQAASNRDETKRLLNELKGTISEQEKKRKERIERQKKKKTEKEQFLKTLGPILDPGPKVFNTVPPKVTQVVEQVGEKDNQNKKGIDKFTNFMPVTKGLNSPYPF